jgi:hypothetical protein
MRPLASSLALAAIAALGLCAWGCTTLGGDCQLNLDCPGMPQPMCSQLLDPGACDTCGQGNCCQELAACAQDTNQTCLFGCYYGLWPLTSACTMPPSAAPFMALVSCLKQSCSPACDAHDLCNPVTGQGCAGAPCDGGYPGTFSCGPIAGPAQPICGACDPFNGPFCGTNLHCAPTTHTCARFCCTDADCGATGKCVLDQTVVFGQPLPISKAMVGICMNGSAADCTAPPMAASKGSCAGSFP